LQIKKKNANQVSKVAPLWRERW